MWVVEAWDMFWTHWTGRNGMIITPVYILVLSCHQERPTMADSITVTLSSSFLLWHLIATRLKEESCHENLYYGYPRCI